MSDSSWQKHLENIWRTHGMCILREPCYAFWRYLLTGAWNTLFGIGIYTLLYGLLGDRVHYLILGIPANILSITNAFLCYKFLSSRRKAMSSGISEMLCGLRRRVSDRDGSAGALGSGVGHASGRGQHSRNRHCYCIQLFRAQVLLLQERKEVWTCLLSLGATNASF